MSEDQANPAPQADAPETLRFGPSARALSQRRWLALVLGLFLLIGLALLLMPESSQALPAYFRWPLVLVFALALSALIQGGLSKPLARREVLLREQALELRRDAFRRLVVFENIRHIRTCQSPSGRLWSLRLDLEDDSVTLRDVEGLARVFAETAQRRPSGTLIEVDESHLDWGEPLPWMVIVLALALLTAVSAGLAGLL